MRKLLLTLSIAAALTAGAAPMSIHAKDLSTASNCQNTSLVQHTASGPCLILSQEEEIKETLKAIFEKFCFRLNIIILNGCTNMPPLDIVVPETPAPDETLPPETAPDNTDTILPDDTDNTTPDITDTTVPDDTNPTVPDNANPTIPDIPDTTIPDHTNPTTPDNGNTTVPDDTDPSVPDEGTGTASVHPYILRIVELVNEERAKAGLNPVTLDTAASSAAQIRTREIVNNFSHTRPNGTSFATALREQGITYRQAGENIAWGQRSPEQVMEAWMNSSGHRANILNASFAYIGVGYEQINGVNYWTQLFYR